MNRSRLIGAVLFLVLCGGAPSFAMFNDDDASSLKDFGFFSSEERSSYALKVLNFGDSDPKYLREKDFEAYEKLCNRFSAPRCGDDNYCERLNLFIFQEGLRKIGEIKKLHREFVKGRRTKRSVAQRINKSSKTARVKLSAWALRFSKKDYGNIQKALKVASQLALDAVRIKRGDSPTKSLPQKTM